MQPQTKSEAGKELTELGGPAEFSAINGSKRAAKSEDRSCVGNKLEKPRETRLNHDSK